MKVLTLLTAVGLVSAAPSSSSSFHTRRQDTVSTKKLLIGAPGQILAADFDGAQFTVKGKDEQEGTGPSWIIFKEPNLVYAVNENSDVLRTFHYDAEAGSLEQVDEVESSAGVVHLEFNKDKTRMLGAGYGAGTIDVWDTSAEDGSLKKLDTLVSDFNLDKEDPEAKAHPHQAVLDPTGQFFVVNDLGTNTILVIDSTNDKFKITNDILVPGGCGPRHGVFHGPADSDKAAKFYTVICEQTNVLLTYKLTYKGDTIEFADEPVSVSTFGDKPTITEARAGAVVISSDGKDIYASNRLTGEETDSIVHFRVSKCGSLTFKQLISSRGELPRMISLGGEGENVLFVGNQKGPDGLVAFRREAATGDLLELPMAAAELGMIAEEGSDLGPQFVLQVATS